VRFVCTSTDNPAITPEPLSKREKEVLKLVAAGYSSKHIIDQLEHQFACRKHPPQKK